MTQTRESSIAAALEAVLDDHEPDSPAARAAVFAVAKAALEKGRATVRAAFEKNGRGAQAVAGNSKLMDGLIGELYGFAARRVYPGANPTAAEHLAVVAVGGYGRGELSPQSDIDLLFVLPYKQTPRMEQIVEYILYLLWDLGLKVGHATRSLDECVRQAKADMTIRTSILEARLIAGDAELYESMCRRFAGEIQSAGGAEFVEAKLSERNKRHQRMGDSRYVLEPNIKDGKGGLRDLHTLAWMGKYLYRVDQMSELVGHGVLNAAEVSKFDKARRFLWALRCHLHYLTERPEDRLTFDVQPEIARRMGYADRAGALGVERFMRRYFLVAKDVGDLTRIFCAALEERHGRRPTLRPRRWFRKRSIDGFRVDGGRLNVAGDDAFSQQPRNLLRLFHVAQEHDLDIHPDALQLVTRNLRLVGARLRADGEANRLFLEILTSRKDPETALRRLNEAGVFGRFITDFGRVVAQMQYDMYHVYTVDEHTIFAIGILSRIECGLLRDELPVASEVVHHLVSRRVLYLAVLLHDIAKGRGGNHSELGAEVARDLCPRLGLTEEETEAVSWLVRHHLLMSEVAFKRDLDDPKTIADFVERVQSPERLRLLLILTVADIRAVGPNVWNGWKASLLRNLYAAAEAQMSGIGAEAQKQRVEAALADLAARLGDWPEADVAAHSRRGYPGYWLAYDGATHARHARLMRKADAAGEVLSVDIRDRPEESATEVTLYGADHPGLFSRIAGAMAVSGANIVDAKVFTTTDGMAIDSFMIQGAAEGAFEGAGRHRRLRKHIAAALAGSLRPAQELAKQKDLPRRSRVFTVAPRVLIDNKASATHTVIEVNGRDRPGLLYDLTRALTGLNLQISNAKISTYGERVVDVFYVRDVFGDQILQENKRARIQESLLAVIDGAAAKKPTGGDSGGNADGGGAAKKRPQPATAAE